MLLLRDVERGLTRYEQLRTSLGIAPNILARRLAALTEAGLLEKRRYSQRPPRDEYLLTDAGRDFLPILMAIGAWGSKYNGAGALSRMIDAETGAAVEPLVIDANNGAPIGSRPLRLEAPD
jgi:DNA-binding HxlR family transcriptional regulator